MTHILFSYQIKTPFGVEDPWIDCPLVLHRTTFSFEHVVPGELYYRLIVKKFIQLIHDNLYDTTFSFQYVVPAVEHEFTVPPGMKAFLSTYSNQI